VRLVWVLLSFFCAVFATVGLGLLIAGLNDLRRARRSRNWPTTPATLVSAELVQRSQPASRESGGSRPYFELLLQFQYTVGQPLQGSSHVRLPPTESGGEEQARAALARYPAGKTLDVAYNPENPSETVLEPGVHGTSFTRGLVGITFLVLAGVIPFIARWFLARL
jgi:hypothetical protein